MTAATRIHRLTLTNFRNYRAAGIATSAQRVVLTGPNGAGKTNMLEAISLLAPGRGLRRAQLDEIAYAANGSTERRRLVGGIRRNHGALGFATLGTGVEAAARPKRCSRAQIPDRPRTGPLGDRLFADHLRVVWLVPGMDGLFLGPAVGAAPVSRPPGARGRCRACGPGRRRLERALRSRNRLLESPAPDPHWLEAIEHETAELAVAVAAARAETVRRLSAACGGTA